MGCSAMRAENDLRHDKIGPLVLRIALPSMLAQFVSVLYSIVDRMYIGNIAEVGALALAGAGVCGPTVTLIAAFAFWVSCGGAPIMSIRMGQRDQAAAERIMSGCFSLLLLFSAGLVLVLLPLRAPLLRLFGASEVTLPYALSYFTLYLLGTPFALLASGMNQLIICQGFARVGMKSVLLGAFLNIALDPVFIFGLHMGVRGAALATVLSQIASCFYVLRFLRGEQPPVRLRFARPDADTAGRVLVMGISPFLIVALDQVMLIAMNALLQRWGGRAQGDFFITCNTIVQSFMLVVTMPLGGISGGTQSILGYNFGAGKPKRVLLAQRYIFAICVGFMVVMFVLAHAAGRYFILLFNSDPAVVQTTYWAICVETLALPLLGAQYTIVDGFTGLGQIQYAMPLSFWRKGVYFTALFLLPALFGAQAIFWAEPICDVVGPLVSLTVYARCIGRLLHRRPAKA